MSTDFPTSLDSFTNPTGTDLQGSEVGGRTHSEMHADVNDAIEAIQTKVGADGSAVQTTHDYKLSGVTGSDKSVSLTGTETLTNKTLTSPTVTNPTTSGTDSGTQTLANKTLTSPRVGTAILDTNGNEVVETPATTSAVNHVKITNAATGNDAAIDAVGGDSNIGITIKGKGTGTVKLGDAELEIPDSDGSTGQVLQTNGSGVLSFTDAATVQSPIASDGSDGDVTISSGTTTLTRDMYYQNLTVNGTGILETAGYRVFVQGTLTVDNTSGAVIRHNGGAGGNASGSGGGTAGAAAAAGYYPASIAGKSGPNGSSSGSTAGTAGENETLCLKNSSGAAGGAGAGSGGAGGAGGTVSSQSAEQVRHSLIAVHFWYNASGTITTPAVLPGSGSGGTGVGAGLTAGGGGGSGGNGGYVGIFAAEMDLTGTGCIQANGGNGGSGGNGSGNVSNGSSGGGGAGGQGGIVILVYGAKTGSGTATASGGTGGAGGTGAGTGVAGSNGVDGLVIEITS